MKKFQAEIADAFAGSGIEAAAGDADVAVGFGGHDGVRKSNAVQKTGDSVSGSRDQPRGLIVKEISGNLFPDPIYFLPFSTPAFQRSLTVV